MDLFLLLLQADGGEAPPEAAPMWPLLIGIVVIFYFLMFRPQIKEQKRRQAMLGGLKKNDHVVTNGGLHGTIASINEDTVVLKVDDSQNVRLKFSRSAIAGPAPGHEPTVEAKKDG